MNMALVTLPVPAYCTTFTALTYEVYNCDLYVMCLCAVNGWQAASLEGKTLIPSSLRSHSIVRWGCPQPSSSLDPALWEPAHYASQSSPPHRTQLLLVQGTQNQLNPPTLNPLPPPLCRNGRSHRHPCKLWIEGIDSPNLSTSVVTLKASPEAGRTERSKQGRVGRVGCGLQCHVTIR